jgi:class 3 adenylate cyclase
VGGRTGQTGPSLFSLDRLADTVQDQTAQLADLHRGLEAVQNKIARLEGLDSRRASFGRRLAAPSPARGPNDGVGTRRSEVTVVFLDLRGFTAFAETSDPEDVMAVLREYHAEMGRLILAHRGTLERFAGDGMMVFFDDPIASRSHALALRMACAMRRRMADLSEQWRRRGYELDFGVGIAQGYATVGAIGFEGRWDYGVIGPVTNLAARLCGEAKPGQILVSRRFLSTVEDLVQAEPLGDLTLKGFLKPVPVFNVIAIRGTEGPASRDRPAPGDLERAEPSEGRSGNWPLTGSDGQTMMPATERFLH